MKRLTAVVLAAVLFASTFASPVSANYQLRAHWHYVNSYIVSNDSMGLWQVVEYYNIKLNGSSPLYRPTVALTAPLECLISYTYFSSLTITSCRFDRVYNTYPPQWQISARWNGCVFGWNVFCSSHGMLLRIMATGVITLRSNW